MIERNTTSDGTNTFDWDAEDRLIKITFSGSGNHTDFSYDPLSKPVKIVEFTSGSVTSTKQFIWCGSEMCEESDASSSLNDGKQFLSLGQINYSGGTGTNRLYQLSHKDIVGATNSSGAEVSAVSYSPWGEATVLSGSAQSFGYSKMYNWTRGSLNLNLTWFRQYNPSLARWLNRDPIGEDGGMNLFGYVGNRPIGRIDPAGLQSFSPSPSGFTNGFGPEPGRYEPVLRFADKDFTGPASTIIAPTAVSVIVGHGSPGDWLISRTTSQKDDIPVSQLARYIKPLTMFQTCHSAEDLGPQLPSAASYTAQHYKVWTIGFKGDINGLYPLGENGQGTVFNPNGEAVIKDFNPSSRSDWAFAQAASGVPINQLRF